MLDIGITALQLVRPLSRIAASFIGRKGDHSEKVAADLDKIAGCAREIAGILQTDADADIGELTGRMEHYATNIHRTLSQAVSEDQGSQLSIDDINIFTNKLQHIVRELHAFDAAKPATRAKVHKGLVRELKLVAGRIGAQAEDIRTQEKPSSWRRVRPALTKAAGTAVTGWAALQTLSTESFESMGDNYHTVISSLKRVFSFKKQFDDNDPNSNIA
jgi:hypothetical protein